MRLFPNTASSRMGVWLPLHCVSSCAMDCRQCACFYCSRDGCEGGRGESRYVRLHVAGTSEASTVRADVSCKMCGSALIEDIALRTLASECLLVGRYIMTSPSLYSHLSADKMVVHLVPAYSLKNSPAPLPLSSSSPGTLSHTHHRHQATPIILRGKTQS